MKYLATLAEDGYGYKTSLHQINFIEGEIRWPEKNKWEKEKEGVWSAGEYRQGKCLELRRKRLAERKLREMGVMRERINSAYDCTGLTFTSGVEVIYATNEYALVRIDTGIDC